MGNYLDYTNDKLHRPRTSKIFEVPKKILLRQTGSYPIVTIDTNGYYTLDSVHNGVLINEKYNIYYIVAVLNSKLIRYIYESKINESGKVFAQVKIIYIDEIPIKEIDIELQNQLFDDKVNCMFELNKKICNLSQKFISYISDKYNLLKITGKIQEFYLYDFNELLKELKKQKIVLQGMEEYSLKEIFDNEKKSILEIKENIEKTDKEIDQMVYELYELTAEEIDLVEGSV